MSDASDNTGPGRYVSLDLGLHFSHPLGCLRPYFEALEQGRALGVRCEGCARTWFPPRRTCCGNSVADNWTELAGEGTVLGITCACDEARTSAHCRPGAHGRIDPPRQDLAGALVKFFGTGQLCGTLSLRELNQGRLGSATYWHFSTFTLVGGALLQHRSYQTIRAQARCRGGPSDPP